jgi:hypothetical protein
MRLEVIGMHARVLSWLASALLLVGGFGCDSGGDGSGDGGIEEGGTSLGPDGSVDGEGGSTSSPDVDGGSSGSGASGSGSDVDGGSSGSGSMSGAGGDSGGTPMASLGKASFPDYSTEDNDAFLAGVVGTHEVAIYRVPAGMESLIGTGELTIEPDGDGFAMQLVAESSAVVSDVKSAGAINALLTPIVGQVFIYEESTIEGYLNVSVTAEGLITGASGGGAELAFRNDIVAYGRAVPPVFADIAGMYEGLSQALTCGQPPVIATVEASGSVTLEGQYNLSCTDASASATWDGNDDYVIPLAMGFELALDKLKGGGSQPPGGISLTLSSIDSDAVITQASAAGPGAEGNIASDSLIKEGELPTQQMFARRKIAPMTIEVEASGDVDMAPWDMDNEEVVIGDDGNLTFAGLTFTFSNALPTEGTTDQVTFRWQTIYMTFSIVAVELTFKTDGSFVGGTFGGSGNGTLAPR